MSISEEQTKRIDPIGLYIIASTPVLFKDDHKHNKIVVRLITDFLSGLFTGKGYTMKPLNAKVAKAKVFEKYSLYFDVDQERIAKVGKKAGCSSVLIMYLAYTGNTLRLKNGLKTYRDCSVYGWLVDSANGTTISSSHTPPKSFEAYLENALAKGKERPEFKFYRNFLIDIASEMLGRFPSRTDDN